MKIREKEAVSPVIGVILMVAITVVLAAIVYLWVIGWIGAPKQPLATQGNVLTWDDKGWRIEITSADKGGETVRSVKYQLVNSAGTVIDVGSLEDVYSRWSDTGAVKYQDNTMEGKLSGGDFIYVKKGTFATGTVDMGSKLLLIFGVTNTKFCEFSLSV